MSIIKIDQQLKRIEISGFEIENEIVFNYFNSLTLNERDDKLFRSIYIGVLALMEDRISSFFAKTSNELGTQLESLKMIFEMKKELFYKTAIKGILAETDIFEFLNNYFKEKKLNDKAVLTGNKEGALEKNKTGDIVCEIDGNDNIKIVIECKFDKSLKLGNIESKEIFTKKSDTAWSQLIESQANRESKSSIIVFDLSLVDISILKNYENVGYIPGIGFIAIVNSQKGDYSNLAIAYMLTRDIILNIKESEYDKEFLFIIINRIIKDINETLLIKTLVENNIENNKLILKQLEKSLLMIEFNKEYLNKFYMNGKLSKKEMLDFYQGDEIKEKFKQVEKEIEKL
jgi:hypothetical protein